jgi:hypothetical protein
MSGNSIHLCLLALEDRLLPSVFTVTNTNDTGDGSLAQGLLSGASEIFFDIPGPGVHTIHRGNFQTAYQTIVPLRVRVRVIPAALGR